MKKQKSTKRALLLSALSLLVCVSMLVGSTFAWFTDSVTSSGNIIKSGTLEVSMDWAEGKEEPTAANWKDASKGAIFDYDKWEPGFVQTRHVKITNDGNLALKYQIKIVPNGAVSDLAKVIDVYYVDPAVQVADRNMLDPGAKLGTLNNVLDLMNTSAAGELLAGESHMVTIALKMQESAGNEYQDMAIGTDFSIQLVATQFTYESDSFNDQYDADAKYPLLVSGKKAMGEELILPFGKTGVEIVVPKEALAGNYTKVVNFENLTEENGEYTYAVDFCAELDGEKVESAAGVKYKTSLKLPQFVSIKEITHNGNVIPLEECEYDAFTGIVTFYTDSFSPFAVVYEETAENPTTEGRKITGGVFTVNPAVDFDTTLADNDSEYIAVDYVKDGSKYYLVSKRDNSIILGDSDNSGSSYTFENKNCPAVTMINDDLLYKYLDNKVESTITNDGLYKTVCLLPGTYDGQNTLTVARDMDIIGLGNAADIVVKKIGIHSATDKKPSERHLFNVSGDASLSEHIKVTISNLYLDATESNSYKGKYWRINEDNAAVQSIRMSKVKCYNLIINDGSSPFYVNGKYAEGGAYMYVENCAAINNVSKIETQDTTYPQIFYYSEFTHKNGVPFTQTSTYKCVVKSQYMDHNDWEW